MSKEPSKVFEFSQVGSRNPSRDVSLQNPQGQGLPMPAAPVLTPQRELYSQHFSGQQNPQGLMPPMPAATRFQESYLPVPLPNQLDPYQYNLEAYQYALQQRYKFGVVTCTIENDQGLKACFFTENNNGEIIIKVRPGSTLRQTDYNTLSFALRGRGLSVIMKTCYASPLDALSESGLSVIISPAPVVGSWMPLPQNPQPAQALPVSSPPVPAVSSRIPSPQSPQMQGPKQATQNSQIGRQVSFFGRNTPRSESSHENTTRKIDRDRMEALRVYKAEVDADVKAGRLYNFFDIANQGVNKLHKQSAVTKVLEYLKKHKNMEGLTLDSNDVAALENGRLNKYVLHLDGYNEAIQSAKSTLQKSR